jgi:hypothetical protein
MRERDSTTRRETRRTSAQFVAAPEEAFGEHGNIDDVVDRLHGCPSTWSYPTRHGPDPAAVGKSVLKLVPDP